MNKKKVAILLFSIALLLNLIIVFFTNVSVDSNMNFVINTSSNKDIVFQVFFSKDDMFKEEYSIKKQYIADHSIQKIAFDIATSTKLIRVDLGEKSSHIEIVDAYFQYKNIKIPVGLESFVDAERTNMIQTMDIVDNYLQIDTSDIDPYIVIGIDNLDVLSKINKYESKALAVKKVIVCTLFDMLFLILYIYSHRFLKIPIDLYRSRKLIFSLAKNDFKTKYAGSYFGIFWAFVQPVITIVLYWFVFQVGFRSTSMDDAPFVIWLMAGLIPWFFYSEVLSSATNCLIEYSYLVKKVVFNITILPSVKIVSSFFVHIFFIAFTVLVCAINGFLPSMYTLQLIYYTICLLVLILGISYVTSSIVLFFRDLGQIINIYLQIAMWMTPIMWHYTIIPKKLLWIFRMNPMYYIVEGYRDSLINKVWFFEKLEYTTYFWIVIGFIFLLGTTVFQKLKPHFADVI